MRISVAADDEVRVITDVSDPNSAAQKIVTAKEGGSSAEFWTYKELLEIASYLHDSVDLQKAYPKDIELMGFVLYHDPADPPRSALVTSLKNVLTKWMLSCSKDDNCLAPPSRRLMQDSELRKILLSYNKLRAEANLPVEGEVEE
jgi:hypothetical protein